MAPGLAGDPGVWPPCPHSPPKCPLQPGTAAPPAFAPAVTQRVSVEPPALGSGRARVPASRPVWRGLGHSRVPQKPARVTQTRPDARGRVKPSSSGHFRWLLAPLPGRGPPCAQPASRGDGSAQARVRATGSSRWDTRAARFWGAASRGGRAGRWGAPGRDPRAAAGGAAVCAQPLRVEAPRLERCLPDIGGGKLKRAGCHPRVRKAK